MKPAGGVDDQHVAPQTDRLGLGRASDLKRRDRSLLKERNVGAPRNDAKLFDGRGAINIARRQHRTLALFFEHQRKFARERRLARALKAAEHDDRRRFGRERDLACGLAHQFDQFFVNDLDDLLPRRQAFEHLAAHSAGGRLFDKIANDDEVDVRFQKRQANLAHRLFDVGLGQLALAVQFTDHCLKFFVQSFKGHGFSPPIAAERRRMSAALFRSRRPTSPLRTRA